VRFGDVVIEILFVFVCKVVLEVFVLLVAAYWG
jgi:hypothetical protein